MLAVKSPTSENGFFPPAFGMCPTLGLYAVQRDVRSSLRNEKERGGCCRQAGWFLLSLWKPVPDSTTGGG